MESHKLLDSKQILATPIFQLLDDCVLLPNGKSAQRMVVVHPGACLIIPLMDDGSLLLVKQYRHAVKECIIEFPAGTLDEGEKPLNCAQRELCEEVGFEGKTWIELGKFFPAPGFVSETVHSFLAKDLSPKKLEADEDEFIEVLRFSPQDFEEAICKGEIVDSKSIAIYYKAKLLKLL